MCVGDLSLATDLRANLRCGAVLCSTSHSSNTPCNGHGRCLSMAEIANDVDDIATHVRYLSRIIYPFETFRPTGEPIHWAYRKNISIFKHFIAHVVISLYILYCGRLRQLTRCGMRPRSTAAHATMDFPDTTAASVPASLAMIPSPT